MVRTCLEKVASVRAGDNGECGLLNDTLPWEFVDTSSPICRAREFRVVKHDKDIVRGDVDVCIPVSLSHAVYQAGRPVSIPSAPA